MNSFEHSVLISKAVPVHSVTQTDLTNNK